MTINSMTPAPQQASSRFSLGYTPALDGLRGVAILLVMGIHADLPFVRGGFIGVDIFFVLSGFLIASLLIQEWDTHGRLHMGAFYARRLLRLAPALLALIVGFNLLVALFHPVTLPRSLHDSVFVLVYGANWAYVANAMQTPYLNHAWSLAIEEQFYIVFPWALMTLLRRVTRPHLALILASAAALSWAWRVGLIASPAPFAHYYAGTDARLDGLLLGAALAAALSTPFASTLRRLARGAPTAALGIMLIGALASGADTVTYIVLLPLVYLSTGLIILGALNLGAPDASPLTRLLAWRPLAALGKRSYSLYLWHWPIGQLVMAVLHLSPLVSGGIGAVVGVACAMLSYRYIERPLLQLKRHYRT